MLAMPGGRPIAGAAGRATPSQGIDRVWPSGHAVTLLSLAAIVLAAYFYNRWLLDPRTFFFADDWHWIYDAEFLPWSPLYSILPGAAYSDRPVGVAFLRTFYHLVGVNHRAFQAALLCIHAVNCLLLYAVALRYTGRIGALVAALLSAMWFTANVAVGWSSGIFDMLGATLCLTTILLRQRAIGSKWTLLYDLAGAACYLAAIRTKEFALGAIALLVVMNLVAERQSIRATIRQLAPYFAVFVVCAVRYAQLLAREAPAAGTPYHLNLTIEGIVDSFGYYVRELFCANGIASPLVPVVSVLALGAGLLAAGEKAQRTAVFGLAGFVILLGPALLLPQHKDALYVYAAHFFFAIAVGALFVRRLVPAFIAVALSIAIAVLPSETMVRFWVSAYYFNRGEIDQARLRSAVEVLREVSPNTSIFITGVEPILNPFEVGPGKSLKVAFRITDLDVVVENAEPELVARFCAAPAPKRVLRFDGHRATDATDSVQAACGGPQPKPG